MKSVFLKGDYTGKRKERQRQAIKEGCDFVLEFHFNSSNNAKAKGGGRSGTARIRKQ